MSDFEHVTEKVGENTFRAYVPEVPGLVVTGSTRSECERLIKVAMKDHLDAVQDYGLELPESQQHLI